MTQPELRPLTTRMKLPPIGARGTASAPLENFSPRGESYGEAVHAQKEALRLLARAKRKEQRLLKEESVLEMSRKKAGIGASMRMQAKQDQGLDFVEQLAGLQAATPDEVPLPAPLSCIQTCTGMWCSIYCDRYFPYRSTYTCTYRCLSSQHV